MSALAHYVELTNQWDTLFGAEAITVPTTPEECKPLFKKLAGELSPENLTCDGELPKQQVAERYAYLTSVWEELEAIYGSEVDESIAYSF